MTLVWSDRSVERLAAIFDHISQDSSERASDIINRMFSRVEQIRAFPESGRLVPKYEQLEVREIIESSYRILYRVSGDRIDIVNILHSRQDY